MLINSLDETRRTVAASESLNLCMAKLNKWGFESSTQFYVVAIPGQAVHPKRSSVQHVTNDWLPCSHGYSTIARCVNAVGLVGSTQGGASRRHSP